MSDKQIRSVRQGREQALRRPAGAVRRGPGNQGRRDLRPDRPERRRQDHVLQRDHGPVHAGFGRLQARRRAVHADRRVPGGEGGHRAYVPEHPSVRRHDRAGKRDGRPPRAHEARPDRRGVPDAVGAQGRARDQGTRAGTAGVRRRAAIRGLHVAQPVVRSPAPSGNRPRAGDRSEAARARRTGRRHERDGEGRAHASCSTRSARTARRSC